MDPMPQPLKRRHRVWWRSFGVATIAAFAGGMAVVGVQYALSFVSAGYPPAVQGLWCGPEKDGEPVPSLSLAGEVGNATPIVTLTSGTSFACRLDAPGADYASWTLVGPSSGMRAGLIDTSLPCQSTSEFENQDPANLRLSACLRSRAGPPGLYLLSVKVMVRGQPTFDRATLALRVVPAEPPPGTTILHSIPLRPSLLLPARSAELVRNAELSASFSDHGLLPQSRTFLRTVYELAPGEEFASASFQARSASNASAVLLAYVPDKRSVTARFTLRSGPLIDRWRGWLSGNVVVRVRRMEEAREISLPATTLDVPGRAGIALPQELDTEGARVRLADSGSDAKVELAPGTPGRFAGAALTARFSDGLLVLEAAP